MSNQINKWYQKTPTQISQELKTDLSDGLSTDDVLALQ